MGRTACTETQCLYKGALYLTFTLLSSYEYDFRSQDFPRGNF